MLSTLLLRLDKRLAGAPDALLSLALLTVALALVIIAFNAKPAFKATALAWVVAP